MYEYISGILKTKKPTEAIIDSSGLGYNIKISLSTYKSLNATGQKASLLTYLHVREDAMVLFGFATETEREVFLNLLAISGIGPKLAQTILSGLTPDELINAIRTGDEKRLNTISGVGKKTAQRLVVELQDKYGNLESAEQDGISVPIKLNSVEHETMLALISLGYKRAAAERAITRAQKDGQIKEVSDLLKNALQVI